MVLVFFFSSSVILFQFTISLGQSADRTKKYVTSGGFVTFYLKKDSPGDADFSIQMTARVIPGKYKMFRGSHVV